MTEAQLSPARWIDLIVDRAPALRAAGVTSVSLGEVRIELAAKDAPAMEAVPSSITDEEHPDPLFDPATFGRRNSVPGYERRDERPDDPEFVEEGES